MEADWIDLDETPLSVVAPALQLLISEGAIPATSDVTLRKAGFSAVERRRLAQDRKLRRRPAGRQGARGIRDRAAQPGTGQWSRGRLTTRSSRSTTRLNWGCRRRSSRRCAGSAHPGRRTRPRRWPAVLQAAISLAADYYDDARDFAQVAGPYTPPVLAPWDEASLRAYIDTALETFSKQFETDSLSFDAQVDQLVAQMALDAGSREIFEAIKNDPKPTRFARVTRPGACAFCLMLAARGAVYRTEETAGFRAHTFPGLCQCDVEPVWNVQGYEPPAHIRAAQSLYADSTDTP
jgi:hypothetical protein